MLVQGSLFVAWWVWRARQNLAVGELLRYVVINLITLLLFAPLLPTALRQVSAWPRTGQPIDAATGIGTVVRWLVYGNTTRVMPWWVYVWPLLFIVVALLPDWLRRRQPFAWRLALPWLWLLVTIGPLFALGLFREANLKFLLPVEIGVALLMARGAWLLWELGSPNLFILLEAAPRLIAGFGLLSLLMISSDALDNLYNVEGFARDNYRQMAQVISAEPRPGDGVVLDAPNQQEVFSYYYHGAAPVVPLPVGLGGDDPATRAAIQNVIREQRRIFVLYWGDSERDPQHVVENELNAVTFQVWSRWYGNVRLVMYAVPQAPASTPTHLLDATFGQSIRLKGFALSADSLHTGDVVGVTLFWQAEAPISARYKVFIHLLDAEGKLVAQRDSEPSNNAAPTTSWIPGQTVIDQHGLLIPSTLSAGRYGLIMGLYDPDQPTHRLAVGGADHIDLGMIEVQP